MEKEIRLFEKIEHILVSICVLAIFIFNNNAGTLGKIITNGSIVICIIYELIDLLMNKPIRINKETLFWILFFAMCIFSITYSYSSSTTLSKCFTLLILTLLLIALMNYLNKDKLNIKNFYYTLCLAATVSCLILLTSSDWKNGVRVNNILGNANQVSAYLSYVIPLLLALYSTKTIKLIPTAGLIGLITFTVAVSGSRSALIVCVAGIVGYIALVIKKDKNIIFKAVMGLIIAVVVIYAAYYLIMNNKALYQIIGRRYISFFQIMKGNNSIINEHSTQGRNEMRELAFSKWIESPWTFLFGNGISYFQKLYGDMGEKSIFCHNNYLEVASGVGLVGFVLYMAVYVRPLLIIWKTRNIQNKKMTSAIITVIIQIFMMHWFVVFYYQKAEILFISLLIAIANELLKSKEGQEDV